MKAICIINKTKKYSYSLDIGKIYDIQMRDTIGTVNVSLNNEMIYYGAESKIFQTLEEIREEKLKQLGI